MLEPLAANLGGDLASIMDKKSVKNSKDLRDSELPKLENLKLDVLTASQLAMGLLQVLFCLALKLYVSVSLKTTP